MIICGVPGENVPPFYLFSFDKLGHSLIFLIFYLLLLLPMQSFPVDMRFRHHLVAAVIAMLYAASTELLQRYVFINRAGDVRDFMADAIGIIVGMFVVLLVQRMRFYEKMMSKLFGERNT